MLDATSVVEPGVATAAVEVEPPPPPQADNIEVTATVRANRWRDFIGIKYQVEIRGLTRQYQIGSDDKSSSDKSDNILPDSVLEKHLSYKYLYIGDDYPDLRLCLTVVSFIGARQSARLTKELST